MFYHESKVELGRAICEDGCASSNGKICRVSWVDVRFKMRINQARKVSC